MRRSVLHLIIQKCLLLPRDQIGVIVIFFNQPMVVYSSSHVTLCSSLLEDLHFPLGERIKLTKGLEIYKRDFATDFRLFCVHVLR